MAEFLFWRQWLLVAGLMMVFRLLMELLSGTGCR